MCVKALKKPCSSPVRQILSRFSLLRLQYQSLYAGDISVDKVANMHIRKIEILLVGAKTNKDYAIARLSQITYAIC